MMTPEERQARKDKKAAGKRTGNLGYLIRLINAGDEAKVAAFSAKCGIPVEEAKARMAAKKQLLAEGAISGGAASVGEAGPSPAAVSAPSDLPVVIVSSPFTVAGQTTNSVVPPDELPRVEFTDPALAAYLSATKPELTASEQAVVIESPAGGEMSANSTETLAAEGALALQAQATDSGFVNGWPKETTATIWNFVPNPLLINIRLDDQRYVSCWNIDRVLAPNDRVRVKIDRVTGDPCYEITDILPRPR